MAIIPKGVDTADYPKLAAAARSVLLDGLTALADQADAVTVVGAQALYLRSVDVDLTVPAFTSDADLGLDPDKLSERPLIEQVMQAAGFVPRADNQPGLWVTTRAVAGRPVDIGLDLMVAEAFAGRGSRSAELPPHGKWVGRRTPGLEATVVDHDPLDIAGLPPDDPRVVTANVAGPAALLIAKAYKLTERIAAGRPERIDNKDAGDVIRLMLATEATDTARRFEALLDHPRCTEVAEAGLRMLHRLFGEARTPGTEMARAALAGDPAERLVHPIASAYLAQLPEPPG